VPVVEQNSGFCGLQRAVHGWIKYLDRGLANGDRVRHKRGVVQQARQALSEGSPTNGGGHPGKVVGEAFVELQNGIAAFEHRGIVLRDLDSGLIDFPSFRDEAEVYLCWIDGETEIGFWHDLDAGYGGRQPL